MIPAARSRADLIDVLALIFAMGFPTLMSWLEFWVLPGSGSAPGPALKWAFGLGKVVQFGFPLVYIHLRERGRIAFDRPNRRGLGEAVAFAGVVALGIFVLYFGLLRGTGYLGETPAKLHAWLTELHAATPAMFLSVALFVSVPHSFLEEYYWRWFVFGGLRRLLPVPAAIILSSLAFMSHHVLVLAYYFPGQFWIAAVPFSLCVAFGGAVWAWIYHRHQSLYAPWLSHLLVDAAIMVVGYDLLRGFWLMH